MGRRGVLCAAVVGLAAVAPAPAAAGPTITASSNRYDQPNVTIAVGDTVAFANSGGAHNFAFDDGPAYPDSPTPPGAAWSGLSRTFTAPGTYPFHCEAHPTEMQGAVTVTSAAPTPTPTPTPTPAPPPGYGPPPPAAPLEIHTLRLDGTTFCTKRSRRCRRPGVRIRIDLSRAAPVNGTLSKRGRRFGRLDLGTVPAGPRTMKFSRSAAGRRLTAGRYALSLRVDAGSARVLRFRVRPS